MTESLVWLLGRGTSAACGLKWVVPNAWRSEPREAQIEKIKLALQKEMKLPTIDKTPLRSFLSQLASGTNRRWRHGFLTTNWDTLLEETIDELNLTEVPPWLSDSTVFHFNGSIDQPTNDYRSPFLLETDEPSQRYQTAEANKAFAKLMWATHVVVVGMTFNCPMDKLLLDEFNTIQDDLPVGGSHWIIVNRNSESVIAVAERIRTTFPNALITRMNKEFEKWVQEGLPPLGELGILC